jgi:hypothetical protein
MLSINGVACHETGCPNADKVWHDGEWVREYECPECGQKCAERDEAGACCNDIDWDDQDFDADNT